jgi:hypothetical protein
MTRVPAKTFQLLDEHVLLSVTDRTDAYPRVIVVHYDKHTFAVKVC